MIDKSAFLAGYEAAKAFRRWKIPIALWKGVKQVYLYGPYTVTWNGPNSFTLAWSMVEDGGSAGIVLMPNLFPARLTGTSTNGGQLQWGVCTANGKLPDIIGGMERVNFSNGMPNKSIVDDTTETMRSVFCGIVFNPPIGTEYTLTVEW